MLMYLAKRIYGTITEIDVESQTNSFVTIRGNKRKTAKTSDYEWIRETREEAKQCLVDWHRKRVESSERRLAEQTKELNEALSL